MHKCVQIEGEYANWILQAKATPTKPMNENTKSPRRSIDLAGECWRLRPDALFLDDRRGDALVILEAFSY